MDFEETISWSRVLRFSVMISKTRLLFELLLFWILTVGTAVSGSQCPDKAACTAKNGIVDGGRCFFIPPSSTPWADVWKVCSDNGGTLAQLHSDSEFNSIVSYVKTAYPTKTSGPDIAGNDRVLLWLAGQDEPGSEAKVCDGTNDNGKKDGAFWYDDASMKNSKMQAAKTWLRNHICDDTDSGSGEMCLFLQVNKNGGLTRDAGCQLAMQPVCMQTAFEQNYKQTIGLCMDEGPTETAQSLSTPQQCADLCMQRLWCRSFNVRYDGSNKMDKCELFWWSVLDTSADPARTKTVTDGSCIHYNYVP